MPLINVEIRVDSLRIIRLSAFFNRAREVSAIAVHESSGGESASPPGNKINISSTPSLRY